MTLTAPQLTERQMQILRLSADGYVYKEIGHQLGIKESTVKNHMVGIMKTLGARTGTHAVYLVFGNNHDGLENIGEAIARHRERLNVECSFPP